MKGLFFLLQPVSLLDYIGDMEFAVPLVDSHTHLQDEIFAGDIPAVLERARKKGVGWLICNGVKEADWQRVREMAGQYREIVPCFGLHPWYVKERSDQWLGVLEEYLERVPSGVGEIGLDRWVQGWDKNQQEEVFRAQLELARRKIRPVTIHCLQAWGWLMDILQEEKPLPAGFLIHAYGGPKELIEPLAALGGYFSFAGNVLDERKIRARESLRQIPPDRLLLETDAPDLMPPPEYCDFATGPDGKKRNEPANLAALVRAVSGLRGESAEVLAESLWENSQHFFGSLLTNNI